MPNKILVLLVGLLAAQCSPRLPAAADDERAERIIRHNIAEFSRQLIAGNYEAVTQAYAPDAKIFPPGLDILRRHEAIRNYWTPPPGRDSRTVHHRVSPEEIQVSGNLAYDWGYYEGRTRLADGSEQAWRGKYLIVWKQTEPDRWKIYLDAWSRVSDN